MTEPNPSNARWSDLDQEAATEELMAAYRKSETDPLQLALAEDGFAQAKERDRQRRECTCNCHRGWRQRIAAHGYRSCRCERWPE